MKDLETTWSHIVARKVAGTREERGMTLTELGEKVGTSHSYVSMVLSRKAKGTEDFFVKCLKELGVPQKQIDEILYSSMYEAMEQEYGTSFAFALKSKFKLSEKGVKDVMKFIQDIQKMEREE